jgi:predicted nuclease of predicted toxin-antitoxin system
MPLSPGLARWLTQGGHDAVHAFSLGLDRAPDTVILERARREDRIVITADLDYPRLLALAHAEGPGLILFRGGCYGESEAIKHLERVLKRFSDDLLAKSIVVIEKNRIRYRPLPL